MGNNTKNPTVLGATWRPGRTRVLMSVSGNAYGYVCGAFSKKLFERTCGKSQKTPNSGWEDSRMI